MQIYCICCLHTPFEIYRVSACVAVLLVIIYNRKLLQWVVVLKYR